MSYCVNCGVELHAGVKHCPLCGTPVYNPNELRRDESAPFFCAGEKVVPPASRREAALLLSAMLCSVAVCCGVLQLLPAHRAHLVALHCRCGGDAVDLAGAASSG